MSRKLICGVDYGTTFIGVCYAWSDAENVSDIHIVSSWPSTGSTGGDYGHQSQVASRISYQPAEQWGYAIEPRAEAFCWTKLLLDRHTIATEYDDKRLREVDGGGILTLPSWKSAEEVVTDFLTHLYKHVMKYLATIITAPILDLTAIEWWFTVPAVWSIRAQEATRKAACKAGFGSRPGDTIHMVKEPEAAAMASLHLTTRENKQLIEVGDGILICDCGGGTVDLASYLIKSITPKLQLDQVCVSEGGKCGSTTIDRAFHGLMQDRFGESFTKLPQSRKGASSKFMGDFERTKRAFGSLTNDTTYGITLPLDVEQSAHYDEAYSEVLVTSTDMRSLFDPVVDHVIALLEQQVNASESGEAVKIKTIILVGGFGSSAYLQDKVRAWAKTNLGLEVPKLQKHWEAICIGAALCGLEGRGIHNRKARYHIGFVFNMPFRSGIDDEHTAIIDWFDGVKRTPNRMSWVINRGGNITNETQKTESFQRKWLKYSEKKWQLDLWQCISHVAPDWFDEDVKLLGTIDIDLTAVNLTGFPSKRKLSSVHPYKAQRYYRVDYDIAIVPEDDLGYMQFKVLVRGDKVGEAKLRFGD
ncbi:uncharacterized protein B0I36DRAFT_385836 [Microdochium trichocladiopsis]|uniref:Actin-like ATPase domain-containing protein n=1 Tax=Microdochium trichocladiopsis TaxID=1682393 RepID=A0A9P9BNX1_9PEZI|nr:uncharacterized protein B0I36DRAFT_385836 [Microdochium trichocladiopsis]KAH7027909.1 hypothetical protein B0I36DRAFT_385836 [Microdochium trichocladiopsis]